MLEQKALDYILETLFIFPYNEGSEYFGSKDDYCKNILLATRRDGIFVDSTFCENIIEARILYNKIRQIYSNPFYQILEEYLISKKRGLSDNFPYSEIFSKFYSLMMKLVNIILISDKEKTYDQIRRDTLIKYLDKLRLGLHPREILKYDSFVLSDEIRDAIIIYYLNLPKDLMILIKKYYKFRGIQEIQFRAQQDQIIKMIAYKDGLITGSVDSTIHVWNKLCNYEIYNNFKERFTRLELLSADKLVIGFESGKMSIWNMKTNEIIDIGGHPQTITSIVVIKGTFYNRYTNYIITGSYDNTIRVWDYENQRSQSILRGHTGGINKIAVKENIIISGSINGEIKIWDERYNSLDVKTNSTNSVNYLEILSKERFVSGSDKENFMSIYNKNVKELELKGHTSNIYCMCILQNGRIATGSADTTIRIWNPINGICEFILRGHIGTITDITPYRNDKIISISHRFMRIWDINTGECKFIISAERFINNPTPLPDGRIATSTNDGDVIIWI